MMLSGRLTSAIALAAVLPLTLTACGGGGSKSSGDAGEAVTSISVLDYFSDEPASTIVAGLLKQCGTSIGVEIKREAVPGDTLIAKVLQQASSKTLPDVLMLDNPDVKQIAATGALLPLNDAGLSADGYAQGVIDAATVDGKLYALQPGANTIGIFYNKDMLEKAGVQPPKTWDELKAAAKKLTANGVYGFAFDATNDYEGSWQFLPSVWTNGGDETDLKTPQVAEALQLWKDLVDDGSASKSVVNWSQGDVNDQFTAGKAAMMLNGPWQIPGLKKTKINYGVVPFPVKSADQTSVAPLGGEGWTVPVTGSDARQAKAVELVKCLNTDENQLAWGKQHGVVPTKTALADQFSKDVPDLAAWPAQVQNARARTGKLGDAWPAPADAMVKAGAK